MLVNFYFSKVNVCAGVMTDILVAEALLQESVDVLNISGNSLRDLCID